MEYNARWEVILYMSITRVTGNFSAKEIFTSGKTLKEKLYLKEIVFTGQYFKIKYRKGS